MCNVLHSIHSRSYITVVIWNAFLYIHYIPYLTPQLLSYLHITIARRNIFWDAQVTYFKTYFPNSCFRFPKKLKVSKKNLYCHVWQDLLHATTRCHTPSLYSGDRIYNANLEGPPLRRNL